MAIAFKSQGDGAGTESSGVSLDLACPATVDANDILIAHVIHLNITTAPSTPADWTLLYGPADLGTGTAVGRAWVFGKLAAGTEDGATIGFGTDGGTSGRYGRIYSFDGYVSGTLAEIVPASSFSDTPSEDDPPAPSVTTTVAGGLAVGLVAQDDNNNVSVWTGMSGGTWAIAVAQFTSTTIGAQGCMCQLEVATPTADPGTITGGTVATAADEGSSIGFAILPEPPPPPPPGPTLAAFESVWTTSTTPKSVVVTDCEVGDFLFVMAGGDDAANVSAVTVSTTAGSTGAWSETFEDTVDHCWYEAGWAEVTGAGSVTVQMAVTGAVNPWGMYVVRARGSDGIGVSGVTAVSSTQVVSLALTESSAVMFLSVDFSASAVGTNWTPSTGVTLVERTNTGNYSVHAAYWDEQPAGTRNYGSTGGSGSEYECVALEILAAPAAGGVTGTADVVLPAFAADATGTVDVEGAATVALPALDTSTTGTLDVAGTATVALPALATTLAGTVATEGVEGTVDAALPALSATAAGSVDVEGTTTALLPALDSSSAGNVEVTGTTTTALPALDATTAGIVQVEGTASAGLPALDATLSGTVEIFGVGGAATVVLPALAVTAAGTIEVAGSAAVVLPTLDVTAAGTVTVPTTGTVDVVLPALAASLAGGLDVAGSVAVVLPALTVDLTGTVLAAGDIAGTVTVLLPALGVTAEGFSDGVPGGSTMGITPNGRGTLTLVAAASGTVGVDTAAVGTVG
jgi:hypothetical protein